MKTVLLAGGMGTRISEETLNVPKPMILIGNKPMIWHIINYYSKFNYLVSPNMDVENLTQLRTTHVF